VGAGGIQVVISMKKRIVNVFLIMSSMALFHLANTLILARSLSMAQMGLFRIVLTVGEFIFVISLLGMDASFIRFFSRNSPSLYSWRKYVYAVIGLSILLSCTLSIVVGRFYAFVPMVIIAVIIAVGLSITNRVFNSLLRAQKYFEQATFLERSSSLIFFVLLLMFALGKNLTFNNALLSYLFAAAVAVFWIVRISIKKIDSGIKQLPSSIFKDGLIFFGILVTIIVMLNANQLFIAKMVSYESLAVYTVTLSVMRVFELTVNALYYVFVPSFNNGKPVKVLKTFIFLIAVGLLIGGFYLLAGKSIIHFLFQGKYDQGARLIPFFVGIGICRIIYIFPASIAGGKASQRNLRRFFYGNCLAAGFGLVLNYIFILKWGLEGAALATLYSWVLAVFLSFFAIKEELFLDPGVSKKSLEREVEQEFVDVSLWDLDK